MAPPLAGYKIFIAVAESDIQYEKILLIDYHIPIKIGYFYWSRMCPTTSVANREMSKNVNL